MKLKGLTKLALSGVALAAVAATLGTSTYAWYVSNSTATVTGITGGTNTDPAGSLLFNKLVLNEGNITAFSSWTNKLNFEDLAVKQNTLLKPTTKDVSGYTPSGSGITATGWHDKGLRPTAVDIDPEATDNAYGYFMFGAQQSDQAKSKITATFGIANTSTATPTQTAYVSKTDITPGVSGATAAGNSFTEDFIYALKFDVRVVALGTGTNLTTAISNGTARGTLAADSFKQRDNLNATYAVKSGWCSNGNAHAYYKELSTDDLNATTTGEGDDAVTTYTIKGGESVAEYSTDGTITLSLTGGTPYVIVVRYWLDGADAQCFDSTINQKFTLDIKMVASLPGDTENYYNA